MHASQYERSTGLNETLAIGALQIHPKPQSHAGHADGPPDPDLHKLAWNPILRLVGHPKSVSLPLTWPPALGICSL